MIVATPRIRYQHQRDSSGCGLACLSMLIGVPYASLREDLRNHSGARGFRTGINDLRAIARPYGWTFGPEELAQRIGNIRRRSIVAINWEHRTTGNWHWVVIDPEDHPGIVFDPRSKRPGGRRSDLSESEPAWYHRLLRRRAI